MLETTGHLPAIIVDAPELWPHLRIVWDMFLVVSSSRSTTFSGLWYIQVSEIVAVLNLFEIRNVDDRLYYTKLIQHVDNVYVKWWYDTHGSKK